MSHTKSPPTQDLTKQNPDYISASKESDLQSLEAPLETPLEAPLKAPLEAPQRMQSLIQEVKSLLNEYKEFQGQQQAAISNTSSVATTSSLQQQASYSTSQHQHTEPLEPLTHASAITAITVNENDFEHYFEHYHDQLTNRLHQMEDELEAILRQSESQELPSSDAEQAHLAMLERIISANENRQDILDNLEEAISSKTKSHHHRVGELCEKIARELGCNEQFVGMIEKASKLHDIGKLSIPESILNKPDRLDPEEYATMKQHTIQGAKLLENSSSKVVQMAQRIALSHHESWNGMGYPHQLAGEDIPLEGRIVAVADVYDALISQRIYKDAWPKEKAIEQIRNRKGTKFDPAIVDAFLEVIEQS